MPYAIRPLPPSWPLNRVGNHMILAIVYVRHQRDLLMSVALDAIDRHRNQTQFHLATSLTEEQVQQVAVYAEALRGVPQQTGFPYGVQWPTVPTCISHLIVQ